MKKALKMVMLAFAMVITMGLAAGMTSEAAGTVRGVVITAPTRYDQCTVYRRDKDLAFRVAARVYATAGADTRVSFYSSNPGVLSVNRATGYAVAKRPGVAYVTVISNSNRRAYDRVKITVKQLTNKVSAYVYRPMSYYGTPNNYTYNIMYGRYYALRYGIAPSNTTYKGVVFRSSNNRVLMVNNRGIIVPRGVGSARVYVMAADGSKKYAVVNINVTRTIQRKVTAVAIRANKTSFILGKDATGLVRGYTAPSNATLRSVAYQSSNTKVVQVNATNGQVKAVGVGKAWIYANALDGSGKSARVLVTVYDKVKSVNFTSTSYQAYVGGTVKTATVLNKGAYAAKVTYSIAPADQKYATVDANTGVVTGKAKGTITVTATADGIAAQTSVKVVDQTLTKVTPKQGSTALMDVDFTGKTADIEKDLIDVLQRANVAAGTAKEIKVNGVKHIVKYTGSAVSLDNKPFASVVKNTGRVSVELTANTVNILNAMQMAAFNGKTYSYSVTLAGHKFTQVAVDAPYMTLTDNGVAYKAYAENGSLYFVGDRSAQLADLANVAAVSVVQN